MGEGQEHKSYVCKYCKKRFPCGRSLGGHMRSHMSNSTFVEADEKLNKRKICSSSTTDGGSNSHMVGFEVGGHVGYGLRENPKKNWRFSDPKEEKSHQMKSLKSLSGHMGSHSEKDSQSLENNGSWTSTENQKLVFDSLSENEAAVPRRKRRSRRSRYKTTTITTSSSFSFANVSSCVSAIEVEQEECAMCLMMLSRDVGYWGGFNVVAESSNNNSLMLAKGVAQKEGNEFVCNVDETLRMIKQKGKKKRSDLRVRRVDSEVSVYGLTRDDEFKEPSLDYEEGFDVYGAESGENLCNETDDQTDLEMYNSFKNKNKFECSTCNKIFHSYQALGGHRASHKRMKGCFASRVESIETYIDIFPEPTPESELTKSYNLESAPQSIETSPKKTKFECPICFKVFSSGQGLGGHKRSHAVGSSEVRGSQNIVIQQQQLPEFHDLLDLNLPAPSEEDTAFKPWWVRGNQKFELMSGLISN
ncbi:hypothetical protein GIB67_007222 [Kingdonia uniflora]|uniref:C2H2-type domain-containing protein n=1 Tax=Kingdonia uniflora TaxID=39325 RepID=A0A7J7NWX5_9MAGN|nr:hypothetical protein GIB67_007222 [Kingdonia uniflora]